MAYIGKQPASVALASSDIADGIISEAKMANDAISLTELKAGTDGEIISWDASGNPVAVGVGSDGQVLTSTGAGSPPAFEAGNPSLLYSTASTVDTGTLTISSTYITSTHRWYKIYLSGKMKTDDVTLRMRYSIGGSDVTSGYSHDNAEIGADSNTTSQGSAAYININHVNNIGNNSNEPFSAVIDFLNPSSTTLTTTTQGQISFGDASDGWRSEIVSGRRNDGTQAHNGITFYPSSGDFEEYALAVYGFKV